MINLPQGFKVGTSEAIDTRLALSFSEMININDNIMPQVYFTICKDDNNIYVYNKDNGVTKETGKFRLYKNSSLDISESINIEKIKSLFN